MLDAAGEEREYGTSNNYAKAAELGKSLFDRKSVIISDALIIYFVERSSYRPSFVKDQDGNGLQGARA